MNQHRRAARPRRAPSIRRHALGAALGAALLSTPAIADVAVVKGGPAPIDAASRGLYVAQAQPNPSDWARQQAYIARLEEEIRRLTGRIEQLEHQQRTQERRFDQLIGDLDQRFQALESGGAGLDAGGDGRTAGQSDEQRRAQEALEGLAEPPGDGELGRIPESAVAGLPRPNPDEVAAPDRNSLTPEQQYEKAVQLLQAGDYQGAQGGLETFLDVHGDHQLASNAAYWLAETHYVRQNYSAAAAAFARNYRAYGKESSKAIDNLLKLGMSLSSLGEQDKACLAYDELTSTFPNRPAHIQQALSRERARAQCT